MRRRFEYSVPTEALSRVMKSIQIRVPSLDVVPTSESFGRVLAEDLVAGVDIPGFDSSEFDGFAVRARDTSGASYDRPVTLRVKGEICLGRGVSWEIDEAEACKIPTGGFLPEGADAVIMVERVVSSGDGMIQIRQPVQSGESIIPKGQDVEKGERILLRGRVLRAQDLGLLNTLGIREIHVFQRPKVPIISSGTELVKDNDQKKTGEVLQSHSYMIARLVEEIGGVPIDMDIVQDDISLLRDKILEALRSSDMVITIGGCSVGDRDYVPDAVERAGKDVVIVQGIKRKPGRVSGVGVVDGRPVVMLPGHIQSALVGFHLFAIPLIRIMGGTAADKSQFTIRAKISEEVAFRRSTEFENVVFVALQKPSAEWSARPLEGDSSQLRTLVKADGFVIASAGKKKLAIGEEVDVNLIPGFSWA